MDIVPDLIAPNAALALPGRTFRLADFTQDDLPAADLVFTRDTLVHYDFATALRALANLQRSGARWLVATTFPDRQDNRDCALGGWRPLNFTLPPVGLPPPLRLIHKGCTETAARTATSRWACGEWRISQSERCAEGVPRAARQPCLPTSRGGATGWGGRIRAYECRY